MMIKIKMKSIEKIYNPQSHASVHALRGVDIDINAGELVAIQGKSGSGKSTLLHIMGCIDRSTKGEYFLDGEMINGKRDSKLAELRNRAFGFVLQQFGLIPERRVWENVSLPLMFGRRVSGREIKQRSYGMLEKVGLLELADRPTSELSGGEQQRVAIARAMVHQPDIILADEPTGNLDSKTAADIMGLFRTLNEQGRTIVIVTHDDEVAKCCQRIVNIQDGLIV